MDPSKALADYGYGSVAWADKMKDWKKQQQERLQHARSDGGGDWEGEDADLPLYVPELLHQTCLLTTRVASWRFNYFSFGADGALELVLLLQKLADG